MGVFFHLNESDISFNDPRLHVKDEFYADFEDEQLRPYLMSELCVIDMLYAVTCMRNEYYKDRLVLKGGHSVRNFVPLLDHRFSFDVDFNLNTAHGYSYGKISSLKKDLHKYSSMNRCTTALNVTKDDSKLYFLLVDYRKQFKAKNLSIVEDPKIEICKTCRIHDNPVVSKMNTMIDLEALGLEPLEFVHISVEEQLVNKLHIIGKPSRQRRHFDAYDVFRICNNNKIDWKKTKKLFVAMVEQGKKRPSEYIIECCRLLDTVKKNTGKRKSFDTVLFRPGFDIDVMIDAVKGYYDFK